MSANSAPAKLLNDHEAGELLRVKPCTIRNERVRGKLGYTRVGARIFYTVEQINEYLERQKVAACAKDDSNPGKSESSGPARNPDVSRAATLGALRGTTSRHDRLGAKALLQRTLMKPAS
jgi:hypothetical protein